jgi:hypothetical protein
LGRSATEKKKGHIRKGKLVINKRICELEFLLKKMQWNEKNSSVDTPAEQGDALFGGHRSAKFGKWKTQLFRKVNTGERRSYTV